MEIIPFSLNAKRYFQTLKGIIYKDKNNYHFEYEAEFFQKQSPQSKKIHTYKYVDYTYNDEIISTSINFEYLLSICQHLKRVWC